MRFVIIGGGPAGNQAATHAARLGVEVTLIERDVVGGLLGCLTPGQAKAVRAHVIEGKSTQQIAADWGVPRERVRGLYKRGMPRLRGSALTRGLVSAT